MKVKYWIFFVLAGCKESTISLSSKHAIHILLCQFWKSTEYQDLELNWTKFGWVSIPAMTNWYQNYKLQMQFDALARSIWVEDWLKNDSTKQQLGGKWVKKIKINVQLCPSKIYSTSHCSSTASTHWHSIYDDIKLVLLCQLIPLNWSFSGQYLWH